MILFLLTFNGISLTKLKRASSFLIIGLLIGLIACGSGGGDNGDDLDPLDPGTEEPSPSPSPSPSASPSPGATATPTTTPVRQTCAGPQNTICDEGFYCKFTDTLGSPDVCGANNATGVCVKQPEVCTEEFNPVCGCDGKLYGNLCDAEAAGQSLRPITDCSN